VACPTRNRARGKAVPLENVNTRVTTIYAPTYARSRPGTSWLVVVYLVAGGIVAPTHHLRS
jgi:hypothetical protein